MGTQKHEKYLDAIDSLKLCGCFCLTEVGYGNNAAQMETTAVYNEKTKGFTINTPTINSHKLWSSNAGYYAQIAVVMAQTYINGVHEGINAFIVRIRDDNLKSLDGVVFDHMGKKMACDGIDNSRIIFRNVEVDRDALLNSMFDIDENGMVKAKIKNKRQRFLKPINILLS